MGDEILFKKIEMKDDVNWIIIYPIGNISRPLAMMTENSFERELRNLGYKVTKIRSE